MLNKNYYNNILFYCSLWLVINQSSIYSAQEINVYGVVSNDDSKGLENVEIKVSGYSISEKSKSDGGFYFQLEVNLDSCDTIYFLFYVCSSNTYFTFSYTTIDYSIIY